MGSCCSRSASTKDVGDGGGDYHQKLSADEIEERRRIQAEAAEKRAKSFQQGGGGEKLKAKSKALEEAEKRNRELGGEPALKWNVS
eukprot:gene35929-43577_t